MSGDPFADGWRDSNPRTASNTVRLAYHGKIVFYGFRNGDARFSQPVFDAISSWQIYHFHDTISTAAMRNYEIVEDNKVLRTDASNIGPFLYKLKQKHPKEYKDILNAIRLVTPFFDDFILEPRESGAKKEVNISWMQKGSDYPLQPYHLSDGSIRFICLVTALLQPNPPSTIIVDEPELGLHPAANGTLAALPPELAPHADQIFGLIDSVFSKDFNKTQEAQ